MKFEIVKDGFEKPIAVIEAGSYEEAWGEALAYLDYSVSKVEK